MLNRLHVTNFKSWEDLDLKLASITGLFGTNSSGKSSVLQFLLMLKQTKDTTDRRLTLDFGGSNSLANLGNFKDVIYGHVESLCLSWTLQWTLPEALNIPDPSGKPTSGLFSGKHLEMKASVGLKQTSPTSSDLRYRFSNTWFSLEPKKSGSPEFQLVAKAEEEASAAQKEFKFERNRGRPWKMPGPIKCYAFPDQAKTYFKNTDFLSEFELGFENLMDRIYYLGPLREYPRREYTWSGARPTDVGQRGEKVVEAILAARFGEEKRHLGPRKQYMPFEAILGHWLKELKLIHEFKVKEIAPGSNLYQILVKRDPQSPEVLITDVGFGVSQMLPVLVLLYYVPENSIVLLEQPEIHLHPSVQSGLADVIINVAKHRNVQVIVESHSEHLLRRLQRRVAEDQLQSDKAALFFCRENRGKSNLMPLGLNPFGEIENWPDNFFGDNFQEIFAAQEAALERKTKMDKRKTGTKR